jgi:hypothetical protein
MKMGCLVIFFLIPLLCCSQKVEVIVPTQPVVVGTAFQVQYVITDPSEFVEASIPIFDSCRLISGPNIYKGNAVVDGKLQPIQNIAYTLVPTATGVLKIGSINVTFKNLPDEQSAIAGITVVPQPKASFNVRSSYTDVALYAPSAKKDREKLIDENLFVKAEVNKTVCYVGEPVVATFKLYSRLQSSSEAEKSPAFYGFSVVDILNINEAHSAVETLNGKIFNTSILRKVQLYPVQSGQLTIDEMYVQNQIQFDDSITHNKTEIQKAIITKPIVITVKALPKKKPESFTGAVGKFSIKAMLRKNEMPLTGQGKLIVSIKGKGNFIQFAQPLIHWPAGIEPFEPTVTDNLDKNTAPIEGERTFEFGFAADAMGHYILPSVSFSFFDVAAKSFKQLATDSLQLTVTKANKKNVIEAIRQKTSTPFVWIILLMLTVVIASLILYNRKKKRPMFKNIIEEPARPNYIQQIASLNIEVLTEKQTCIELQKILSGFLKENFSLISSQQKEELQSILQECQLCIYSHGNEGQKEELVKRSISLIKSI